MVWMKKATGKSPGYHRYSDEDIKRVSWCMDNGIKAAVIPNGTKWQVELSVNKNIHLDPYKYDAGEAYEKMYKYYKYYYDKHNKQ